ncbi:ClpX C4-type zinc finger protein, partial [uncultured Helicobacter sp.]
MDNANKKECSFCKAKESSYNPLIAGSTPGVYICRNCISVIYKTLTGYMKHDKEESDEEEPMLMNTPSPKELKA